MLTLLLVVAAFAVKETAVALPLAFVAWAWTLPHTDAGANAVLRRQLQSLLPVAAAARAISLCRKFGEQIDTTSTSGSASSSR